ncbi:MAG: hypothetical protein V5A44_11805, partial [Haloarculaceae archaeon]
MYAVRAVVTIAVAVAFAVSAATPALGGAALAASSGPAVEGGQSAQPEPGFLQTSVDPDVVVLRADVDESGTAEWTVEYRLRLDDENTTEAFESVRSDIETNASAFTARFADGMSRTVASAENATGREMGLVNVTVSADRQTFGQEYGVITYRFTWTNFATTDGDRLHAGDAIAELFLDSETALVLGYPEGYGVESVQPRPTENRTNAVVWRGPVDFGPEEPRLVVAPGAGEGGGFPATLRFVAGAVVLLLAVVGGAWLYRERTTDVPPPATGESADAAGAGESGGGAAAAADDGDEPEEPPEELLSNEERVIKLLDESGGRIKQQRIAEEFDWTDAKTSQVVGSLRDDDAVETFRIGRENVVTLPEESDLIDGGDD